MGLSWTHVLIVVLSFVVEGKFPNSWAMSRAALRVLEKGWPTGTTSRGPNAKTPYCQPGALDDAKGEMPDTTPHGVCLAPQVEKHCHARPPIKARQGEIEARQLPAGAFRPRRRIHLAPYPCACATLCSLA